MTDGSLQLVACPRPFSTDRVECQLPAGGSIADLMREAGIDPDPIFARVFLDDLLIPKAYWTRVRPKPGHRIIVRVIPTGGGGGKDVLRIVALIAVLAAAMTIPGAQWGLALPPGSIGYAVATAGIAIGGSLAVNALIPPSKPHFDALTGGIGQTSPTLSLTGSRNQLIPYGPVPRVYGRHRIFPPLAARPFTEISGNDQFLRLLFCVGYGPLLMSDLKIGQTPIGEFTGVEVEMRMGFPGESPLTLFTQQIFEDALSILLTQAGGAQTRVSRPDSAELSVDVTFPNGLVAFDAAGNPGPRTVNIQVEYRPVGTGPWTAVGGTAATFDSAETDMAGDNNDLRFESKFQGSPVSLGRSLIVSLANIFIERATESVRVDESSIFGMKIKWISVLPRRVGGVYSTAAQIKVAIETNPTANALITVSFKAGNDGTGSINPAAQAGLQFGTQGPVFYPLTGGHDAIGQFNITDNRPTLVRASLRWSVTPGTYEVRLTRITADTTTATIRDQVFWTALRSIKSETVQPVQLTGLALVALRIKATDQLSGVVDQLNLIAQSVLPDWDGTEWVHGPSSNPASIYRDIVQGSANARPLADSRIDLTALQDWHVACAAAGRQFNGVIDFRTTLFELLRDIAAVGRASFGMKDGKYSIVRDVQQSVPIQHFSARNSWGFRGTKVFLDLPHALKVRFINPDADWQQDERIVYDDGFSAANATKFETLDLFGVTSPDQAWKEGRYHLAVAKLRPERYELNVDVENLVCTRGDLVRVVHDVPLFGAGVARVKSVITDGSGNATSITIDDVLTMESGKSYAVRFRKQSGASVVQPVTTIVGDQMTLNFTTPIAPANPPQIGDLVLMGLLGAESVELLVKGIVPGPDLTAKLILVDAAPGVHTADSGMIPPFTSQITDPPLLATPPLPPLVTQVKSDETVLLRHADGALESRIVVSLQFASGGPAPVTHVEAQFRPTGSSSAYTGLFAPVSGLTPEVSIVPVQDGLSYDIRLRTVNQIGGTSEWTGVIQHTVIGKTTPPPDVQTFLREGDRLAWAYPDPPRDFAGFKLRRHFGQRTVWSDAQPLHEGLLAETVFLFQSLDLGTVTYLLKAVDVAGNESSTPATLVVNLGDLLVENLLFTVDKKAASFPGTITNGAIDAGNLKATSVGTNVFWSGNDANPFWTSEAAAFWVGQFMQMQYLTSILPDADKVPCTILLDLTVVAQAWSVKYRVTGTATFWRGTDSTLFWTGDANLFWAQSNAAFLPWPGRVDDATRQFYEFLLSTEAGPTQGVISKYLIKLDVPDVLERVEDVVVSGAGTTRIPITKTFRAISNVNLTLQDDGGSAIGVKAFDKGTGGPPLTNGPLVKCFDAGGALVAGKVDATLQGY